MLCLSGLRVRDVGGEVGGVAPPVLLMFCMEPGGELLGVIGVMVMGPGDVLRARGETGVVCFRCRSDEDLIIILRLSFSVNESVLCGVDGSFGDGVPLEE